MPAHWVNLTIASRLIGVKEPMLGRRARRGCYGPIKIGTNGALLISTRGLELAARCFFGCEQIEAAKAGEPLPGDRPYSLITRRRHSIEEIGRAVVMTQHMEPIQ